MTLGLPLGPEAFTIHVAVALAQEPDIEITDQKTLTIELRVQGARLTINLDNLYLQYQRAPSALDELTASTVALAKTTDQAKAIPDLSEVAERLYPQVKPQGYLDMVRAQGMSPLVARPLVAELSIIYVIDAPDSMIPVNERDLVAWQIDELTLHQIAMSNFEQRQVECDVLGEGPQRLFVCQSLDGYDATRVLLGAMLDDWASEIRPHHLLLGLPNRDFLIGFSDADPNTVAAIAAQVHRDAATRPYSITDRLLVWGNGALREYRP